MSTPPKDHRIVVAGFLAALLVLLLVWPQNFPRPINVAVTGTPGLSIKGEWTVDGVHHPFHAILPTNFVTTSRQLSFELIREGAPGTFKVELTPDHTIKGPMTTESDYGIRGLVAFEGDQEQRALTSFGQ